MTSTLFCSYRAQFFSEWEMFQTKVEEKIKTQLFKDCAMYEIMWKNIAQPKRLHTTTRHMRVSRWVNKATNTHSWNMWYLLIFYCINGWTNVHQCYVICTWPVLFDNKQIQLWRKNVNIKVALLLLTAILNIQKE